MAQKAQPHHPARIIALLAAKLAHQLSRFLARLRADLLLVVLVLVALASAYARTLAPSLSWANDGADGGDLISAAATLGVAHPTGYPTYLLVLRLFLLLPAGDLAFRANLCSAAAAIAAALCIYGIVRRFDAPSSWLSRAAAAASALAFGLAPLVWSQASIAEVYTLNALFVALILFFILDAEAGKPAMWWQGLIVGVALGVHITIGLLAAVWLGLIVVRAPAGMRLRTLFRSASFVAPGLLVYLYLPLRAAAHPPVNWGAPYTWSGFWWVVSGAIYRDLPFGLPPQLLYGRLAAWSGLLADQYGWAGLGLGLFGLFYGAPKRRAVIWITAGLAAMYSIFAIAYNSADSYAYLIPAILIFALWIGLGLLKLLEMLGTQGAYAVPALVALAIIALVWPAPAQLQHIDASRDTRAADFASRVFGDAPARSIVLTAGDRDTFALWYYHYVAGRRPDLVVISGPLLVQPWYRENLRAVYPSLHVPERPATSWGAALAKANPLLGPVCHTNTEIAPALVCEATPNMQH